MVLRAFIWWMSAQPHQPGGEHKDAIPAPKISAIEGHEKLESHGRNRARTAAGEGVDRGAEVKAPAAETPWARKSSVAKSNRNGTIRKRPFRRCG